MPDRQNPRVEELDLGRASQWVRKRIFQVMQKQNIVWVDELCAHDEQEVAGFENSSGLSLSPKCMGCLNRALARIGREFGDNKSPQERYAPTSSTQSPEHIDDAKILEVFLGFLKLRSQGNQPSIRPERFSEGARLVRELISDMLAALPPVDERNRAQVEFVEQLYELIEWIHKESTLLDF